MRCTRLALPWRTAAQAREAGDYSAGFLRRYEDRLWDALGSELKLSTKLHNLGPLALPDELGHSQGCQKCRGSGDMICGMMADAVPRKMLTNPLFYLRLLWK